MEKALLEGEHKGEIEQLQGDQRNIDRLKERQHAVNASVASHKEQVRGARAAAVVISLCCIEQPS